MNLQTTLSVFAGGPGSGCNPEVGTCGRKPGAGVVGIGDEKGIVKLYRAISDWKYDKSTGVGRDADEEHLAIAMQLEAMNSYTKPDSQFSYKEAVRDYRDELKEAGGFEEKYAYTSSGGKVDAVAVFRINENNKVLGIDHIVAAPDAIGKGAGRRLLQHLESVGREGGATKIQLSSHSGSEKFYEGMGFTRFGSRLGNYEKNLGG